MPENFYWYYDNFFYKVTNMESPRKNNDCYFYYYSTCTKGDSCTFRHEPSALGCETVCSFWKEGKCVNAHCNFRHMELRKNRKAIPCYWEAKPGGCLKPHCPFFHKSNRDSSSDSLGSAELQSSDISKTLGQSTSQSSDCDRLMVQFNETNYGNPVDPLVVNFEEESDNESASTISPSKVNQSRTVKVKTLEEIRLEKIQAESAAYYSYPGVQEATDAGAAVEDADDLRTRIMKRLNIKLDEAPDMKDFQVLSLDEIRKRKKRKTEYKSPFDDEMEEDPDKANDAKKQRVILNKNVADNLSTVKVKSLAEIRAEKASNLGSNKRKLGDSDVLTTCPEVSSTSNTEELLETSEHCVSEEIPAKRLRRKVSSSTDEIISNKPKLFRDKQEQVVESYLPESMDENMDKPDLGEEESEDEHNDSSSEKKTSVEVEFKRETSKIDDILLFDEEDLEDSNINFKGEEEIFKDIDNLLND